MTKLDSKVISTRIYEELETMVSILDDNKRNLAKRQRSIMLSNRISALKQQLTTFYVTKEISSEERAELLTKVLDNYLNNQILNQLANKALVEDNIWYDLTQYYFYLFNSKCFNK
ncbi:MAG: hypothetical protein GF308_06180 [Candidatus Heimdallarchaeota archaeon]|nr:hypothetical protein [Candidatus Heimdallarchaeota archaeon]